MITFEDIKPRSKLSGVDTSGVITVVSSERYGEQAVKIIAGSARSMGIEVKD